MASSGPAAAEIVAEAVTGAVSPPPDTETVLVMLPSSAGEAYSVTAAS